MLSHFRSVGKRAAALVAIALLSILVLAPAVAWGAGGPILPTSQAGRTGVALAVLTLLGLMGMAYTASKAQSGLGSLLYVNQANASPPNWVIVGEVVDAVMGGRNLFDDTTNLQSSAKEFLATLPDPGKLEVTMNRVSGDAGQVLVNAAYRAAPPTRLEYKIVLPINTLDGQSTLGDVYDFLAYVEAFNPDIHTDKKIAQKATFQITGGVTFTRGS